MGRWKSKRSGERWTPEAVIAAVPWFALRELIGTAPAALEATLLSASRMASSPIVTVNLWFDRQVLDEPFVGLPGRAMQWVFDTQAVFGGDTARLSLVSSGASPLVALTNPELIAIAHRELARGAAGRSRRQARPRHGRSRAARDVFARTGAAGAPAGADAGSGARIWPATGSTRGSPLRSKAPCAPAIGPPPAPGPAECNPSSSTTRSSRSKARIARGSSGCSCATCSTRWQACTSPRSVRSWDGSRSSWVPRPSGPRCATGCGRCSASRIFRRPGAGRTTSTSCRRRFSATSAIGPPSRSA